ncbi:MAG: UDP-N-acetylmuramoyl-L-alanyl-D-glutamate--2,6-diaminopimelate ligase, partial [Erysipelotrichaceae bacterium]|nr:UDP-N-acetylmuramoyl-L-alanyl-D-glutamate--2,6-diaminopimelate ligase [Erysipelotrichaceae bacterium]
IVDYAHTPDGLQQIFDYAKHITPEGKRLISVFGSAGKRDVKKRVVFGELADRFCDLIILTEDDPRNEDPQDIANEIASGIRDTTYLFIESRYDAIRQAIEVANTGDVVVILGKGDDPYMAREYGKEEWMGDQAAARDVIRKYYYGNEENEHEEE